MSQAEELLNSLLADDTSAAITDDEPHIVVNPDRTISIPDELKHIAVEHDHNVETVIFDCPRYWDEHDFSTMHAYINYVRPDGYKDQYPVKNLRVDETDESIIHFDWTVSRNVTKKRGNITFLVCIKTLNEAGEEEPHWNSRLNSELIIDPGLEYIDSENNDLPDSVQSYLVIHPVSNGVYFLDLEKAGLTPVPVDGSATSIKADCSKLREILAKDVIKLQIPISVSGVTNHITLFTLAEYRQELDVYRLANTSTMYSNDIPTSYVINIDISIDTISVSVFKMNNASAVAT